MSGDNSAQRQQRRLARSFVPDASQIRVEPEALTYHHITPAAAAGRIIGPIIADNGR